MEEIRNIQYENNIAESFKLVVLSGAYAGTYDIQEPDGFDSVNITIDINEEYFNVDNFIFGDTAKMKFLEYYDKIAFDLVSKVYEEQGGDGQIVFKWLINKNGSEMDVLGDGYEINLNKYKTGYEKSKRYIEIEIKKRESQNKFLAREDTSINLFASKNLDGKPIEPIKPREIIHKELNKNLQSHWYMDARYAVNIPILSHVSPPLYFFPIMNRAAESQLGVYPILPDSMLNEDPIKNNLSQFGTEEKMTAIKGQVKIISTLIERGRMFIADVDYRELHLEVSNFEIEAISRNNIFVYETPPQLALCWFKIKDGVIQEIGELGRSYTYTNNDIPIQNLNILNKKVKLTNITKGTEIRVGCVCIWKNDNNKALNIENIQKNKDEKRTIYAYIKKTHTSIEITTEVEGLSRKSKGVTLYNALNKIVENYTSGQMFLQSKTLNESEEGWRNQYVSTGIFMRNIPGITTNKLNTSFKSLFYDGASKLLALGFDLVDDKVIIEDIGYFFKDSLTYDLSNKDFVQDIFTIENDLNSSYNNLVFGTKKYSTKKKGDLGNFNTKMECTTPIKSVKKKLDKTTSLIIDEYKIQDLITDRSTSTNDSDDDIVLLDTIEKEINIDKGTFNKLVHENNGGLVLVTTERGWDELPLSVGMDITITEGLNVGTWKIEKIEVTRLALNKKNGIQTGTATTKIEYELKNIIKSRNATIEEGFYTAENVANKNTCVNLIHNPKYQLNRWFPLFGSALIKKPNNENIIVNSYKNNGKVKVEVNKDVIRDGINGVETLDDAVSLERLRKQNRIFFDNRKIEITLRNVTFSEFYNLYNRWRYGSENTESRGYINVKTSEGVLSVYPFGNSALEYDRAYNELTIKGKVKSSKGRIKIFDKTFDNTFE